MKRTVWKSLTGSLVLAAAVVMGAGGGAHASTNILSGNVCSPFFPPELTVGQGVFHTQMGVINLAPDNLDRFVECPILRDNTGSTTGMSNLTVNTVTQSGTANVVCLGIITTKFGSIKISKQLQVTATTAGVPIKFGATLNKSDAGSGSFDLQCDMFNGAVISSIEYGEP